MAIISKERRSNKERRAHEVRFLDTYKWVKIVLPSSKSRTSFFPLYRQDPKASESLRLRDPSVFPPTRLHRILLPRTQPPPWSNKYSISSNPVRPPFVRSNIIDRTARSSRGRGSAFLGSFGGNFESIGTHTLRRKNQLTQKLGNFVSSSIRSLTFCSPSFHAKSLLGCVHEREKASLLFIFFFWKEEKKGCNEY